MDNSDDLTLLASGLIKFRKLRENVESETIPMSKAEAIVKFTELAPVVETIVSKFDLTNHQGWTSYEFDPVKTVNYQQELGNYMNLLVSLSYSVGFARFQDTFFDKVNELDTN
jgi:hypothetical protein